MGQVKKIVLVVLCMVTIALSCIVSTSAVEAPPTTLEMGTRQGFNRFTINDYLMFYLLICDDYDMNGNKPCMGILAYNLAEASLVAEKWTKEQATQWYVFLNQPIASSEILTYLTYTESGSQRFVIRLTDELLTGDAYLYEEIGYAPQFVYNPLQWGDGGSRNLWVGKDYDFMRHQIQQDATTSNGDPVYSSFWAWRYYDEFNDIDEVNIQFRVEVYAYDSNYTSLDTDFTPYQLTVNRPVLSVSSYAHDEFKRGQDSGYALGFNEGFEKGRDEVTIKEYSWKDLIGGLVTAPVTFLQTALDFEIFGVNMSGFVMFLITTLIVLAILTLVIRLVL